MAQNPYDQACRYLTKLEPARMIGWLLGLAEDAFAFRRWLDTRVLRFPGEPERTCDTVAHLENLRAGGEPWAGVIEFQIDPDPLMFGRLLGYLGPLWLEHKPAVQRGDRFSIGAIVVNLTGRGQTARSLTWAEAGWHGQLPLTEWNLSVLSAASILSDIAAGKIPMVVLPWIPLMQGGGESGMIEAWKALAGSEPDPRRRSDYGGLALVFAEAAQCAENWKAQLKEWNVVQSQQVLEWQAEARKAGRDEGRREGRDEGRREGRDEGRREGRDEGRREGRDEGRRLLLIRQGKRKFGELDSATEVALNAITDSDRLERLADAMLTANSWTELLATP